MKELRIFYNGLGKIVWTHGLEGSGKFPTTIEEDLAARPVGTKCLVIESEVEISSFMASDDNRVIDDKLVVGEPRPVILPESPRDLFTEIDELKTRIEKLEA